jgi:ATP phosphoribosyltransferase regulatory subunit HisZ
MTTAATRRSITIDHVVIASNQPYEKVLEGIQSQMGSEEGWRQTEQRIQDLVAAQASLEQVEETIERQLGTSDFTIFRLVPEAALYALVHFDVYEDDTGKTFVAYDNFASLLAQYERAGIRG